ncbi:MAG: phenylacetate--CoA ligase family protein [Candidatus Omnitrophica bacterium]|nr:phenylacetate--CoA ligase family protein [Candidatus Omnitrophota bacterium]
MAADRMSWKKINRLLTHFRRLDGRYAEFRRPIKNWDDFRRMPVTTRAELADFVHKHGLQDACHVTATSGTTETRLLVGRQRQCFEAHIRRLASVYKSIGIEKGELCLNLCSYSLNSGGFLMETAYRAAGAGVVALGPLDSKEKTSEAAWLVRKLRPTLVNSYTNQLYQLFAELGRGHSIRRCVVNGEPLFPDFKARIEKMSGVRIYDHFGAMEVSGFAIAQKPGDKFMRVFDEDLLLEVVGDDGSAALTGRGALLVTDTENTCMPFIRYRLGDRVELVRRRGSLWIKVLGRLADSILFGGAVYSCQEIVRTVEEVVGHPEFFLLVEKDPLTYRDRVVLNIAPRDAARRPAIAAALKNNKALSGLAVIRPFKGDIPKTSTGKFRHILDNRGKG